MTKLRLASVLVLAIAACGRNADENLTGAEEATDSVNVIDSEGGMMSVAVDGTEAAKPGQSSSATAEQVAAKAAMRAKALYQPAGCVTATVTGNVVKYVFNDCTGPRRLHIASGELDVTYTVDAAGIHAAATGSGVSANGATLDVAANALYTIDASGNKSLAVTTSGSGTGPLGNSFTRAGSYTITWTATCHTLNGSWSTTVSGATRSTTVSDFTRCDGACPAAGGTITHTGFRGRTITVTFDGSATAHWSTSGGLMGTVDLMCTPAT